MTMELLNLIQGADVEWKPLGEILVRTKGTKITAKQMKELDKSDGPIKIFAGGKTVAFVKFDDIPEKDILTETSIIVKSRGIIEFEYYDKPFSHKAEMWSYHSEDENISIKYVYYFLKMNEKYFQNLGSKMQMPQIATPDTDKYKIPIPSLEIQQKVVEILDKMTDYVTELTAELTAELTLRQKQYAYYRDKLLTFDESLGVEWRALGEICEIKRGKRLVKNELEEVGKYPVYQNSMTPLGYYHQFNFDGDNTFIICAGAAGEIGYMSENFWAADDVSVLTVPSNLMSRYLYHFLLTKQNSIKSKVRRASVPRLSKISFENIKIPVPTLSEQKRIVEILDSFDKLTSNLTDGLPHEIKLRKKQYEHWREQLLSFKRE